ncbi:MAG: chemotaxis protein CheW [Burkholderiales bacterium]
MNTRTEALNVDTFLPYMRDVVRCEESLRELNLTWRMIEASAKINCPTEARSILPMMTATREGFERLEKELVASLVEERVANVLGEVGTKASHVVDIVVRNLYERTADVGFLATDRDLCDFVAGTRLTRADVTARLRAYRDKYTVYDDILLLDTRGNVLTQIDEESPVEGSHDLLIEQTLKSDTYLETFRATDLRPGKRCALIYSRRMHAADGRVVGLLCLSFNFEDEMAGIFRSRRDAEERAVMLLLDGEQRVIASADELWVPLGTRVPVNHDAAAKLVVFSGREYLVQTYRPAGYQGYPGPAGWQGQVMIPVDVAFTGQRNRALDGLDSATASGLLTHARSFCPPLYEIVTAAQSIRRVVWNGQVMTASQRRDLHKLKSILEQISETGSRTNALFSQSIRDLYDTVLTSSMRRSEFVARLLVDLLDRNLYERSDDCRWWALTPELRQALAHPGAPGSPNAERLTDILGAINALYTVYTRLVVYDAEGTIVAATQATRPDGTSVVGSVIEEDTLNAVRALGSPQQYHVTPFRPSPLYDDRPTYIYHAAVRDPQQADRVVGGIGIVFDAAPELEAMLRSALVGHGPGTVALFINRNGTVISSIDPARPAGSQLTLPPDLLAMVNGASVSRIIEHAGQYGVLGCSVNSGYREFKVQDGYREDVIAVLFEPLGEVRDAAVLRRSDDTQDLLIESDALGGGEEFATFYIDGQLHALPAGCVLEALPGSEIAPVSAGRSAWRLGTAALQGSAETPRYVWVYDLLGLVSGSPSKETAELQVIIVRAEGHEFGLLVSTLQGVPEFLPEQIVELPAQMRQSPRFVTRLINANRGKLLIPVLDPSELMLSLQGRPEAAEPVPPSAHALAR